MPGHCRITTRQGSVYITEEDYSSFIDRWSTAEVAEDVLSVDTVVGAAIFPPEILCIRASEIVSVQTMSEEAWAIQQQTENDHYRRILDASPQEQIVEVMRRLVDRDT